MLERFKDIVQGVRDRIQNPFSESNRTPFAGAFTIALLLYNWPLVFSLFSFDPNSTRIEKIHTITNYLSGESWVRRIFIPVLWAFGSIILFYFFNNVSLGVTTFFNRWVKSFVLYYTDDSKVVSKEAYEKLNSRVGKIKKRIDALEKELLESEETGNSLDGQLSQMTNRYDQLVQEHEKLKETLGNAKAPFRIVYARYGPEGVGHDVSDVVRRLISTSGQFVVDNNTLEGDPIPFDIKSLFVIYEGINGTRILTATEGEIVQFANDTIDTKQTELSKKKHMYLINQEKIGEIFSGPWILTFTARGGVKDQEPVIVDGSGRYFAHSKLRFYLRSISIENNSRKIMLNKIDLNRRLHTKETLTIQDPELIIGTDSKGYKLEYRRQNITE
jgi:hypothetical protein